jgi:hypothetical protein
VIAQEQSPLTIGWNIRGLPQDVGYGKTVLLRDRHVDAGHEREVISHVAFVAVAEIGADIFRPLIGLGQEHLARSVGVELRTHPFDDCVRLRQVLVVGAFAFDQIRNGIEPKPVHTHVEPSPHHLHHCEDDTRVVVVEVRLMRKEAVPVVGLRLRIPGPVRFLRVAEDDPRSGVTLVGIAPDVPVARIGIRPVAARPLEPGMLVRGMIDHELGDHPQLAALGFLHEAPELLHGAEVGIDATVVRDIVAVVTPRRGIERQQPQGGNPELMQIIELLCEADEISDAVVIAVRERLDVQLIDDRVLEPELVHVELGFNFDVRSRVHGTLRQSSGISMPDPAPDRCAGARLPIRSHAVLR